MFKTPHTLILPIFLLLAIAMISSSGGRDDLRANAPGDPSGCEGCHSGGTGSVTGTLTGAPATIIPGNTYTLTLSAGDFGSGEMAGFQIAASSGAAFPTNVGTFTPGAGTRITPANRLVQTSPQSYSGGVASWTFDWTAPTENTYSEVTFFYSINSADGTGGTSNDVTFSGNSANIPVPVHWAYSRMEQQPDANRILWGTHTEENSASFEIEHSYDGIIFRNIGSVDAALYSKTVQHYAFEDRRNLEGLSYYRIKQIDMDGHFDYSSVLQIENRASDIKLYPTVSTGSFQIEGYDDEGVIRVFDLNGQEQYRSTYNQTLDLNHLMAGSYVLRIEDAFGRPVEIFRVVKL